MGEIGIHLADIFIAHVQSAAKTLDICRAESEFSGATDQADTSGSGIHFFTHYGGGAVGRVIVDHKNVERRFKRQDGINNGCRVLALVIHRDYNHSFASAKLGGMC